MIQPCSNYYSFQFKTGSCRIHYLDWGCVDQPVLFCAHGLTRNSRDFDYLARELCTEYRVIAVDYPGRNLSEWLCDKNDYVIPNYVEISLGLLDKLKLKTVNWLGTSMGGLIGMIMGVYYPQRLNTLIINDVGPEIPAQAAKRIIDYLSMDLQFNSLDEFEQHLRLIYAPFGDLDDQHWQHLTTHSHIIDSSGKIRPNYDPGIVIPFKENPALDTDLWDIWTQIQTRIYLLHGENSDILSTCVIERMKQLQPGLISKTIENTGHAPALMDNTQIELIKNWLKH